MPEVAKHSALWADFGEGDAVEDVERILRLPLASEFVFVAMVSTEFLSSVFSLTKSVVPSARALSGPMVSEGVVQGKRSREL